MARAHVHTDLVQRGADANTGLSRMCLGAPDDLDGRGAVRQGVDLYDVSIEPDERDGERLHVLGVNVGHGDLV